MQPSTNNKEGEGEGWFSGFFGGASSSSSSSSSGSANGSSVPFDLSKARPQKREELPVSSVRGYEELTSVPILPPLYAARALQEKVDHLTRIMPQHSFCPEAIKERKMFILRVDTQIKDAEERLQAQIEAWRTRKIDCIRVRQYDEQITAFRRAASVVTHVQKQAKPNKKRKTDVLPSKSAYDRKQQRGGFGKFGCKEEFNRRHPDSDDEGEPPRKKSGFGHLGTKAQYARQYPDEDSDPDFEEDDEAECLA